MPLAAIPDLGDGLNLVDIWLALHTGEAAWAVIQAKNLDPSHIVSANGSDSMVMQRLADIPAERWIRLCEAAGWVPAHCAALSWCEGATLDMVLEKFTGLASPLSPGNVVERACTFINPALLPEPKLSAIAAAAKGNAQGAAILVAARKELPELDIDRPQIENHPLLVNLLNPRIARHNETAKPEKVPLLTLRAASAKSASAAPSPAPATPERAYRYPDFQQRLFTLMQLRQWTRALIEEAVATGTSTPIAGPRGERFQRFVHPKTGCSVVVVPETREVVHIGRADYVYGLPAGADGRAPPAMPQAAKAGQALVLVRLPFELAVVARPVLASRQSETVYCLTPAPPLPYDEAPEFSAGQHVVCGLRSYESGTFLTALRRYEVPSG